ncbi:lipase/serine esterase, putative [Talaromyces stipitatus ATCC 10500]|uniref:Lipase/serine esterase, putative n=1 Tax=Talaromyces stipitatus (strain ATCC 10500 / CBS 375.48 / QM 6759 / NRRL 1006) TaxID=441959 RepID=B8MNV3_TALSN|nr:lipase/serine esterase, putative [Talaromyces stipitatus ATCC 10500]EED14192.1 lipase/serine esterase, putative [Talaromyces stipitatus ATCC 10500]
MLITPRTYQLSQEDTDRWNRTSDNVHLSPRFHTLLGWRADKAEAIQAYKMLLVHQSGYVRVGEVVRYTLTYTPSLDQILPTPTELHVKIKNTSAIPLRAAYLHGPYTLYTSCYPSDFDPNQQYHDSEIRGIPQYEPYLKAGGSWTASIPVPEETRLTVPGARHANYSSSNVGSDSDEEARRRSITWIIEITSQVIFSSSAAVHFELLVGRDQKSLEFGINGSLSSSGIPSPAHINDHQSLRSVAHGDSPFIVTKGVFSKSVTLVFDDLKSLWNRPECSAFKEREEINSKLIASSNKSRSRHPIPAADLSPRLEHHAGSNKKRRIHLVILTHGLHSNLGADMLYLKESIDAAAEEAKKAKKKSGLSDTNYTGRGSEISGKKEDDEEVIVRGFPGNVTRTERGIQYLGKRLAKYVLLMTYPDQPYLPVKQRKQKNNAIASPEISIHNDPWADRPSDCQVTSISFIGHSLGGLIQTYAIAYIQKHSPEFFERIKPINFVALATPFLGLSNENPVYVRFALDLGLVGKTGQDLGLSWMSPKVRSRWDAIISKFAGNSGPSQQQQAPASKPLLRILPAGPAHQVLQRFRNRTVYSNVVNDGIVPLRTSCLLFLDWRGLDRVQKARRGNGLVGTMAEWGWAELTGANSVSPTTHHHPHHHRRSHSNLSVGDGTQHQTVEGISTPTSHGQVSPGLHPTQSPTQGHLLGDSPLHTEPEPMSPVSTSSNSRELPPPSPNPFNNLFGMFQSKQSRSSSSSKKSTKIIRRSQTLAPSGESEHNMNSVESYPPIVRGNSLYDDEDLSAPPRTTIFESAGDVLRPPLPPTEFIIDPTSRPRTIFHDRIYHPEDIPPPVLKKRGTIFSGSRGSNNDTDVDVDQVAAQGYKGSGLRVEEKIARAYHQGLSWRKVLVRLEPDAHNNIIVRRMFANAYGWPVIKHLVDNHFGDTYSARTEDALESNRERAKPLDFRVTDSGEETFGQTNTESPQQLPFRQHASLPPDIDAQEHALETSEYDGTATRPADKGSPASRKSNDSAKWTDRYFSGGDSASDAQSDHEQSI